VHVLAALVVALAALAAVWAVACVSQGERPALPAPAAPELPAVVPGAPILPTGPAPAPRPTPDTTIGAGPGSPAPSTIPASAAARPPAPAATSLEHDPALAAALEEAFHGVDGRLSLAVKDLGSGRGALLNATAELPAASVFKLPVLYSVFEAGVPLSEQLQITERIKDFDLGTLELGVGDTLSVAEALERMVTISDNSSAILLADRVGATRVNANLAALGLGSTHYLTDRLTTSALDMLVLLEQIARGRAVSPEASAEMVHLLLRQRVNDRLPRLLPDTAQVAHKTGNLPDVVNDVGIIYGPRSTVIVAALVADTAGPGGAAQGIARAALAAHRYFEAQPAVVGRPAIPPRPARPIPPVRREVRVAPAPPPPAEPGPTPAGSSPGGAAARPIA
jgi:beta-lactamase class A